MVFKLFKSVCCLIAYTLNLMACTLELVMLLAYGANYYILIIVCMGCLMSKYSPRCDCGIGLRQHYLATHCAPNTSPWYHPDLNHDAWCVYGSRVIARFRAVRAMRHACGRSRTTDSVGLLFLITFVYLCYLIVFLAIRSLEVKPSSV